MNPQHASPPFKVLTESTFDAEVLQSGGHFLVAFWAPWSKPCQVIDPVLEEVAHACADELEVAKVNADDNPNLSLWFGVQHIPTLLHFAGGKLRGQLVGTVSAEAILNLLARARGNAR